MGGSGGSSESLLPPKVLPGASRESEAVVVVGAGGSFPALALASAPQGVPSPTQVKSGRLHGGLPLLLCAGLSARCCLPGAP